MSTASLCFLVGLLVASSWLSVILTSRETTECDVPLKQEGSPYAVGEGGDMDLSRSTSDCPTMPSNSTCPITNLWSAQNLISSPKILPTQSGFVWDEAADWNHPDAIKNGSSVVNGALSGTSSGVLWDFQHQQSRDGPFPTPTRLGSHHQPAATNGTTGGSLRTYAGSTYGTSPTVNLAGGVNIPFHAWVHEGRSGLRGDTRFRREPAIPVQDGYRFMDHVPHLQSGGGSQTSRTSST